MARKPIARSKTRTTAKTPEGEFEVVEETVVVEKPAKAAFGTEGMLVLVTFVALVAAFVLINMEMHSAFGKGWPV